jgi:hypothetical protein
MTAPLQTMPAEATLGEVLLAMVDRSDERNHDR